MDEAKKMYGEMMWRVILTLIVIAVVLIGSLLYVGFYATGLGIIQKIVVVLIALIIIGVVVSIIWMAGWSRYMDKKTWAKFKSPK